MCNHIVFLALIACKEVTLVFIAPESVDRLGIWCTARRCFVGFILILPRLVVVVYYDVECFFVVRRVEVMFVFIAPESIHRLC